MKKPRFTLTQLLVVIGIVATIACLALPIGTQMREHGRTIQELYNLRQLGIATIAYATDHNDQIFSKDTPGGWPWVLHSKYASYLAEDEKTVSDWKTFKSPFDKRPDRAESTTGQGVPVSYGINVNILTQSGSNAFDGKIDKCTSPNQLILMAPNVDLTQSLLVFIPGTGDSNVALNVPKNPPATNSENRGTHARRSQITVLFADGHVANIKYRDFATASGADGSARWQPIHNP
jgi:prepilin-type processing-associated H-X9-DG protein